MEPDWPCIDDVRYIGFIILFSLLLHMFEDFYNLPLNWKPQVKTDHYLEKISITELNQTDTESCN